MSKLPGNAGASVLADKSLEFYRDPVSFCRQRIEKHGGRVFQCRLLNRPTVFICSVRGMRELLCGMYVNATHLRVRLRVLQVSPGSRCSSETKCLSPLRTVRPVVVKRFNLRTVASDNFLI